MGSTVRVDEAWQHQPAAQVDTVCERAALPFKLPRVGHVGDVAISYRNHGVAQVPHAVLGFRDGGFRVGFRRKTQAGAAQVGDAHDQLPR